MLLTVSSVVFVFVCVVLVLLVLVQSDKGGGLSGSFGGGAAGANSVMGAQNTENILTVGTVTFAVLYLALAIFVSFWVARIDMEKKGAQITSENIENVSGAAGTTAPVGTPAPVE